MKSKICYKCKEEKELSYFYKNKYNLIDGKSSYCKKCMINYVKNDYTKNKSTYGVRSILWKRDKYQWYRDLKLTLKCEKCGFNHPGALDFHHLDPNTKEFTIGDTVCDHYSIEKVMKEIEKCIVLCSNCHRIKHWEQKEINFKNKFE